MFKRIRKMLDYIECAFINSNEPPVEIKPFRGFYVEENHDRQQSLSLFGSRDFIYKHPDAPNDAVLHVYRSFNLINVKPGDVDYSAVYMLLQSQKMIEKAFEGV
jgi:hypothetical protein